MTQVDLRIGKMILQRRKHKGYRKREKKRSKEGKKMDIGNNFMNEIK